jgi:hypothetical protein
LKHYLRPLSYGSGTLRASTAVNLFGIVRFCKLEEHECINLLRVLWKAGITSITYPCTVQIHVSFLLTELGSIFHLPTGSKKCRTQAKANGYFHPNAKYAPHFRKTEQYFPFSHSQQLAMHMKPISRFSIPILLSRL